MKMNDYQKNKKHIPEVEKNHAVGGSVAANRDTGSAGAPVDYDKSAVLRKAMKENSRKCFGGRLFYYNNHVDMPMVCHAIPKNYKQVAFDKLSYWYHWTNANTVGKFLIYEGSRDISDYVCFSFSLKKGARSMREIMKDPERAGLCKNLFTDLVKLLHSYSMELDGAYAPLCAISLDTVYMDRQGNLAILPLVCVNNEYPKGFPMEAGTDEMDDTTDLHTAAMLTYQVLSGIEYEKPSEGKRMKDLKEPAEMVYCMENCMVSFASKRFNLREVYARLCTGAAPAQRAEPSGNRGPRPKDPEGNPIYESDEESDEMMGRGLRAGLRRMLDAFFNPDSELETVTTAGRPEPKRKSGKRSGSEHSYRFAKAVREDDEDYADDSGDDYNGDIDIDDDDF